MRRAHRWTLISGGSLLGLLVMVVLVVSWVAGQGLLHPDRRVGSTTPSDVGLAWSYANFTTEDFVPIVGWWMPTDASPEDNATIVFLHGYGDSKDQSLAVARLLVPDGYNMLAFDFRACGESGGDYTTAGILEVREVDASIAWLTAQPGFPADPRIALMGWSMGGAVAIRAASKIDVADAVVADAAYSRLRNIVDTSIVEFIRDAIGFSVPRWPIGPLSVQFASWSVGVDLDDFPPTDALGKLDVPVLLIQGLDDKTVVPANVEELAAAGGPDVEVHKVPGVGHVGSLDNDPEGYRSLVGAFLERSLAADPS